MSQGNGFDLRYDVCICMYARGIMNTMVRTAEAKNMSGGMFEYGGRHMNELTRKRIDALIYRYRYVCMNCFVCTCIYACTYVYINSYSIGEVFVRFVDKVLQTGRRGKTADSCDEGTHCK